MWRGALLGVLLLGGAFVACADEFLAGYDLIRDEGTDENRRGAMNFLGAGVSVADDSANNESEVTIEGDLTVVGDCTTGACFSGSTGTTLTFEGDAGANFTLLYDTTDDDFELSDDLTIEDATPHLRLTDTTAAHDDFEWYADGSQVYLTDVTESIELIRFDAANYLFLRGGSTTYSWPSVDGANGQVLTTNASGLLTWQDDDTGAGGGDPILIDGTAVTDASGVDLIQGTTGIDITFNASASPDTATFAFDATEISSLTWGAGAFTTMTFDAGVTDPVLTASSAVLNLSTGALQEAGKPVVVDTTDVAEVDGRSLTIVASTLDADAELFTKTICILIETPVGADDLLWFRTDNAITVTAVDCIVENATSAVAQVVECDADGNLCGSANTRVDESITCAVTNTADDGTIGNAGVVAGAWFRLQVGAVTGTPGQQTTCVTFSADD